MVESKLQITATFGRMSFMDLRMIATVSKIPLMTKEELKKFREKLGLSQEQLADRLKVARNTVSRWELGERKIPEFLDLALRTIEKDLLSVQNGN